MVGAVIFELTTSCTRNKRATRLRYAPTLSEKHNGVDRAFAILKFALWEHFSVAGAVLPPLDVRQVAGIVADSEDQDMTLDSSPEYKVLYVGRWRLTITNRSPQLRFPPRLHSARIDLRSGPPELSSEVVLF